jgi:hypothetical protein
MSGGRRHLAERGITNSHRSPLWGRAAYPSEKTEPRPRPVQTKPVEGASFHMAKELETLEQTCALPPSPPRPLAGALWARAELGFALCILHVYTVSV